MVPDDQGLKVYERAKAVVIPEESIQHTLHKELSMRKLYARWMPHLLNDDHKQIRNQLP